MKAPALSPLAALRFVAAALFVLALPAMLALPAAASGTQGSVEQCPQPDNLVSVTETPWAQEWLRYEEAWRFSQGAGVTVAVVDTGVDARHPQLAGRVLPGADVVDLRADLGLETESAENVAAPVALPGDVDCHGHGTFVAGIIGAEPSDEHPFIGVAPAATILPVRQAHTADDGTAGGMARAIVVAVDAGASVINISSSVEQEAQVLVDAVAYAEAHDVVIVASVSNNGALPNRSRSYPAVLPGVLSVGSIDANGGRSTTSETGPELDLMAPGHQVTGTVANSSGLGVQNGTSYATAFVSGTAALVRSRFPELTAAEVIHRLMVTSDYSGRNRPDDEYGWGVVNPGRALTAHLPEEEAAATGSGLVRSGQAGPVPIEAAVTEETTAAVRPVVAVAAIGGVWGLAGVALLGAGVVAAGRRRGWQPVDRPERRPASTHTIRRLTEIR